MTAQNRQAGEGGPSGVADVVSIGAHPAYGPGFKRLATAQVCAARQALGMNRAEFADHLAGLLGWKVVPDAAGRWEEGSVPPADVALACQAITGGDPLGGLSLLEPVPPAFPASVLSGLWVTSYQFSGSGGERCHADIARLTALSDREVRAANHPPEPRTEGRALPFRNQVRARLAGRHLVGEWKNTSDARYFGTLQLAVLSGETVMEGLYTSLASDVAVSSGHWKWVRLAVGTGEEDDLMNVTLRDPAKLHELVTGRLKYDAPLTLAEVRKDS
jgi:hypothetical protein